jgi:hypothetical protein
MKQLLTAATVQSSEHRLSYRSSLDGIQRRGANDLFEHCQAEACAIAAVRWQPRRPAQRIDN